MTSFSSRSKFSTTTIIVFYALANLKYTYIRYRAAFMPAQLFYEVVLRKLGFASPSLFVFYVLADLKYLYIRYKLSALLEMEQTSLLAISTPATDGAETVNFYSSMMDAKLHGKPMFKTLKVGLGKSLAAPLCFFMARAHRHHFSSPQTACEACIAAGLATSCTHMEVSCRHGLMFCTNASSHTLLFYFSRSRSARHGSHGKYTHSLSPTHVFLFSHPLFRTHLFF